MDRFLSSIEMKMKVELSTHDFSLLEFKNPHPEKDINKNCGCKNKCKEMQTYFFTRKANLLCYGTKIVSR